MSDESIEEMPDDIIPLDIGCFRRKAAKELKEERDPAKLDARLEQLKGEAMARLEKHGLPR